MCVCVTGGNAVDEETLELLYPLKRGSGPYGEKYAKILFYWEKFSRIGEILYPRNRTFLVTREILTTKYRQYFCDFMGFL